MTSRRKKRKAGEIPQERLHALLAQASFFSNRIHNQLSPTSDTSLKPSANDMIALVDIITEILDINEELALDSHTPPADTNQPIQ